MLHASVQERGFFSAPAHRYSQGSCAYLIHPFSKKFLDYGLSRCAAKTGAALGRLNIAFASTALKLHSFRNTFASPLLNPIATIFQESQSTIGRTPDNFLPSRFPPYNVSSAWSNLLKILLLQINIGRSLHNHHLNSPGPDLPQNEGLGTINLWIPPKFFGGIIQRKRRAKNLRIVIINIRYSLTNFVKFKGLTMYLALVVLIMISLTGHHLEAGSFPDHPVQLIVPYGAGSGSDLIARAIQPYAEKTLGAPLIISNVPGADSRIGMKKLYNAKPDGFTIGLAGFPTPIIHEYLFDVPYKALNFSFIYAWIMSPQVIFVPENSWKSFDEFILESRKRPLTFGLPGMGTSVHLLALAMEKQLNTKFRFIAFSGSNEGFTALAGNHIDANAAGADAALGLVRAKKVRPIFIWSFHPDSNFPDIPLSTSYNIPTFVVTRGVFGPPNIPNARVQALEKAFSRAAAEPKVAEWSKARGYDTISWNAKQYRQEIEKQQTMVKEYKDYLKAR